MYDNHWQVRVAASIVNMVPGVNKVIGLEDGRVVVLVNYTKAIDREAAVENIANRLDSTCYVDPRAWSDTKFWHVQVSKVVDVIVA